MRWILMGALVAGIGCAGAGFDCTEAEGLAFERALGTTKWDDNFQSQFDLDGDGIVTAADYAAYLGECE